MDRFSFCIRIAVILAVFAALPLHAQETGTSGSGSGSTGSGSSGSGSGSSGSTGTSQPGGSVPSTRGQQPGPPQPQFQSPVFVNGRILMDTGQPVPESVSVALGCGARSLQVIYTDVKGYFQFALGAGAQSNIDYSASNDSPLSGIGNGNPSSLGETGRFGGSQNMLNGCEIRVSVPGYVPLSQTITDRGSITGIEVGTLHLTRIAGVSGSSISVTSLLVPNGARKEFERGEKEARNNHLDAAKQHLEKAVTQYDKYAAAWNRLGSLYAATQDGEKSRQAFDKAIAADPHYIPPYLGLANLQLQSNEIEPAIETAGKALELNSTIGVAHFIQAIGNFKLGQLDAAEKSAQLAEKGPHENMPDLHALHAQILVQQQDYSNAAAQMRAYLKEFPQGQFAGPLKKSLQQIESSAANTENKSGPTQQPIAP